MLCKKFLTVAIIFALVSAQMLTAQEANSQEASKTKLAVLRMTYDAFSEEEKALVNSTFYRHLGREKRMTVMTEAEVREKLIPLGIEPAEVTGESGYINAGQTLNVDFVLVGNMEKIGNFVDVTFRVFTMPRGSQKRYPGGKTLDVLVKEEIPNIVNLIYRDIGLEEKLEEEKVQLPSPAQETEPAPQVKPRKNPPWVLIVVGGAVGGVLTAILLGSGGGDSNGTLQQALPAPPIVP